MTYGTIRRTARRVDEWWMARTPRQFLFHMGVTYPVLIITLMAAMVAVVEMGA